MNGEMKTGMKIRVLLADDHEPFRRGLRGVINLNGDMEVIGVAENGEQAVTMARELRPDVILMDVKMPVMDGAEATSRILAEMPEMKILALTIYDMEEFRADMMQAGARGYILKDCDTEELAAAIRDNANRPKS